MTNYPTTIKTHYRDDSEGRSLFCSGRSVYLHLATKTLDEVTCKACRRRLIAITKKVVA